LYRRILVDLGVLDPKSLALLEDTARLYIVTAEELPALWEAGRLLARLTQIGLAPERLHLVVNMKKRRGDSVDHGTGEGFRAQSTGRWRNRARRWKSSCRGPFHRREVADAQGNSEAGGAYVGEGPSAPPVGIQAGAAGPRVSIAVRSAFAAKADQHGLTPMTDQVRDLLRDVVANRRLRNRSHHPVDHFAQAAHERLAEPGVRGWLFEVPQVTFSGEYSFPMRMAISGLSSG
jgi:hypothetical protein